MKKFSKFALGTALSALAMIATTSTVAATEIAQPPASVGTATTIVIPPNVLSAKFIDQNGVNHTLAELKGETAILVPFLTLCGDTCPFTTANMLQIDQRLTNLHKTKIKVIGIDVDPYRDNPARLMAYSMIINSHFQMWTAIGTTSTPSFTKAQLSMKNPVGSGDINPNLLAIEKFLGYSVQVVPQGNPPSTDWKSPYQALTYDINHSDGFAIIDGSQKVRFISGTFPAFTGVLSKTLATFMHYKSNVYKKPVYKDGWTPTEALNAISWVTQTRL
jgi:cytochrome oxidase Cu insertion factor (SCO1/SenC/PrrC family)